MKPDSVQLLREGRILKGALTTLMPPLRGIWVQLALGHSNPIACRTSELAGQEVRGTSCSWAPTGDVGGYVAQIALVLGCARVREDFGHRGHWIQDKRRDLLGIHPRAD